MAECLRTERVTTLWLTSGLFHELVDYDADAFSGVHQILMGGDVVSATHVRTLAGAVPGCRIINGYGPTENTTFTACYPVSDAGVLGATVPIGKPIANTSVYVLDDRRQLVPIGVVGELYTGGDGVARGYLNAPALTAERFVADPFAADAAARLYRTGDRVRWLANGNLEFLGRLDHQLKVRGFRIEPAEIEACLNAHPEVRECVVVGQMEQGHRRLVAYVVFSAEVPLAEAELRRYLKARLPEHMVPSVFVGLDRLPLTAYGKIDRAALPEVSSAAPSRARAGLSEAASSAPDRAHDAERDVASVASCTQECVSVTSRSDIERRMAAVWSDVLGMPNVDPDDNFFDLGGHSLLAVRLFARIEREFGLALPLASLFHAQACATWPIPWTRERTQVALLSVTAPHTAGRLANHSAATTCRSHVRLHLHMPPKRHCRTDPIASQAGSCA